MTAILENVYINKLLERVKKYINTTHRTIKTKPVHVNSKTY